MIVECILSTMNSAGEPNFAPMGLVWGDQEITIRPFLQTSTYRNLLATGYGVASLTDDVQAFIKAGLLRETLPHFAAKAVPGVVYQGACSWRELQVIAAKDDGLRADVHCRVLESGWLRDFIGFCRARNAVIEAAIVATRLQFYDPKWILERLSDFAEIVQKTGDAPEELAFQEISAYIRRWLHANDLYPPGNG
jgi:uncharacterized protein